MKRKAIRVLLWFTLSGLIATGCLVREPVVLHPTEPVVVREAPPALREEVITTAPSAAHVWIPGYWIHENGRYVWVPGHWELRPRTEAAWVRGHWDQTPEGWVWTPGHWE